MQALASSSSYPAISLLFDIDESLLLTLLNKSSVEFSVEVSPEFRGPFDSLFSNKRSNEVN